MCRALPAEEIEQQFSGRSGNAGHRFPPPRPDRPDGPRPLKLKTRAAQSSRDLGAIDFYVAFQHWRLAIILEGVYARYVHGAMGTDANAPEVAALGDSIYSLIDGAQAALARL